MWKKLTEYLELSLQKKIDNLSHVHNYELISKNDVVGNEGEIPMGKKYTYVCKDPSCKHMKINKTY